MVLKCLIINQLWCKKRSNIFFLCLDYWPAYSIILFKTLYNKETISKFAATETNTLFIRGSIIPNLHGVKSRIILYAEREISGLDLHQKVRIWSLVRRGFDSPTPCRSAPILTGSRYGNIKAAGFFWF